MVKFRVLRATLLLFSAMTVLLFTSGCGSTTTTVDVSYQPTFLPIIFTIDSSGNISVQASASIVTAVGTFAVGLGDTANVAEENALKPDDNTLLVIIRHEQNGQVVDNAYKIQTKQDEVHVVTNGTTKIDVTYNKVFIDASNGDVQNITISDGQSTPAITPIPTQFINREDYAGSLQSDTPTGILIQGTSSQLSMYFTSMPSTGLFNGELSTSENKVDKDYFIQGGKVPFNETNQFSQVSQQKIQQLYNKYPAISPSDTLLWFYAASAASNNVGQDIISAVGCEFYGYLSDGGEVVNGLWYPPASNVAGGTFQLLRTLSPV